jgi:hypothetical protein
MRGIFQLAEQQDCRVILSGDTRQHTSVERGDALRLLETYAGLKPAELTEIRRQKDAQYRDAVREFSNDNPKGGFEKLDQMGAIKELCSVDITLYLVFPVASISLVFYYIYRGYQASSPTWRAINFRKRGRFSFC